MIKVATYNRFGAFGVILLTLIMLANPANAQQDPRFNQYYFNPVGVNPAYAGSRDVMSIALLYRKQWIGLDGAPETQTISFNMPLQNKTMGIGAQITNDILGPRTATTASGIYAYRIRAGRGRLAFGVRASVTNYVFDWDKIEFRDEEGFTNQGKESYLAPLFDFGTYYNTKKFFAGIEISNLNQPRYTFIDTAQNQTTLTRLRSGGTVYAGYAWEIAKNWVFRPTVLYKQAGLTPGFIDVNLNFLVSKALWMGIGIRPTYGGSINFEYLIADKYRIGYAFDYPYNRLRAGHIGSHEIFLGIDLDTRRSRLLSPRYF